MRSSATALYDAGGSAPDVTVCATPASTDTTDMNSVVDPSGRARTPNGTCELVPRCAAGDNRSETMPARRNKFTPAELSGCVAHHVPRWSGTPGRIRFRVASPKRIWSMNSSDLPIAAKRDGSSAANAVVAIVRERNKVLS